MLTLIHRTITIKRITIESSLLAFARNSSQRDTEGIKFLDSLRKFYLRFIPALRVVLINPGRSIQFTRRRNFIPVKPSEMMSRIEGEVPGHAMSR